MGMPVVTVASGGIPVVDVTATTGRGTPVTEATNGFGRAVTKVANSGMAVAYETLVTWPPATVTDPFFSSVKLLMGFEGANGSTGAPGMTDQSGAAHGNAAVSGTTQISTAQAMFGSSSLALGGGGGAFYADSADWRLSAANSDQFTVDVAVRFNAIAASVIVLSQYTVDGTFSWSVQTNASNNLEFVYSPDGSFASAVAVVGPVPVINTWYQVAVDKAATGKIRLYVGGAMVGSVTPANSSFFDSSVRFGIGATDAGGGPLNGFIDELRITKGVARYANDSGYTVATLPFPRS